jgi:hypothetical protein
LLTILAVYLQDYLSTRIETSVTRHFAKKIAQFCQKIAQNGALVNKNFFPKNFLVKILEFRDKKAAQI